MSLRRKSFDVLPALRVRGKPLRGALRTVTLAWMFGVVWMSCIMGSQMNLFCRMLGFSNKTFGWMSAIAFGAYLAQLVAALAIERTGQRKVQFIFFATIHRFLWLAIAVVPLLMGPGPAAVGTFLALYGLTMVLAHLHMPAWQNWMGDLIPRRIRGRYFANRRIWTVPIQILVVAVTGILLDLATVDGAPMTSADQPALRWALPAVFAVGAIFGMIDILLFLPLREIASPQLTQPRPPRRSLPVALGKGAMALVRIFVEAVRDRAFLHVGLYSACMGFAMTVGGFFFIRNALENLRYSKFGTNLVFMICGSVAGLLTVRLWGRLNDRWGRRPVLLLATIGVIFSPAGWFFIPADSFSNTSWNWLLGQANWVAYALGIVTCMLGASMWSAIELVRLNILLGFSETTGRSKYIAAAAVFTAVGGFLGGAFGGWVAETYSFLQENPIRLGPFLYNNWHLTFLASTAARATAVLCLIGMPDPGSKPFREVVGIMRFNVYNNVLPRLFWPLRAVGQWRAQRRSRRRPPERPE